MTTSDDVPEGDDRTVLDQLARQNGANEEEPQRIVTASPLAASFVGALSEMSEIPAKETADMGSHRYKYAPLEDILPIIRPILARWGLGVTQDVSSDGTTISVTTILWHVGGERYVSSPLVMKVGNTPQSAGSATTYARRYSLLPFLGLATEDDDGAEASKAAPQARQASVPKAVAPAARTREETEIRALLASLADADARTIRDGFTARFGSNLSGLDPVAHPAALGWVQEQIERLAAPQFPGEPDVPRDEHGDPL